LELLKDAEVAARDLHGVARRQQQLKLGAGGGVRPVSSVRHTHASGYGFELRV
jgi:hypothetical protein